MNVAAVAPNTVFPTPNATAAAASAASNAANPIQDTNSMFMKLLTAQLANQSPLNPVDPSQFTSQLVEFNMLDQLAQINQTLQSALTPLGTTTSNGSSSNPSPQGVI
jgi:flagellar basal-body rod modification protein FlgD